MSKYIVIKRLMAKNEIVHRSKLPVYFSCDIISNISISVDIVDGRPTPMYRDNITGDKFAVGSHMLEVVEMRG